MEVFRELEVGADVSTMAHVVSEIGKSLPDDWSRDESAEALARSAPVSTQRVAYCFRCDKREGRPAAMLILAEKDGTTFFVSNIIPTERHQLAHAEYNTILEDFFRRLFRPNVDKFDLEYKFTSAHAVLGDWMAAETAECLREFSAWANRGTGASHPKDRQRWNAFVLSAYRTGTDLDPSTLKRWLIEVEDWSPEIAEQLALEYEYGRELLSYAADFQVA